MCDSEVGFKIIPFFQFPAKSPVFTHVVTTMNGLTTIRSRGKDVQLMLRNEFDRYQDDHTGAWYLVIASGTAFGFSIDLVACTFIAVLCFLLILINPGNFKLQSDKS